MFENAFGNESQKKLKSLQNRQSKIEREIATLEKELKVSDTALENNLHKCKGLIQTTNQNKCIYRLDKNTNEILEKYNSISGGLHISI